MSIISSFAHFEDASSAFSRRLPARATASHDRSARELRVTGPCDHARSWTFLCLILIIIVLFGVTSFAPLYSILVFFNYVRRAALFSLSIVLSCFIYSIFLQPWFCPAALAANAAAFGRSLRWVFQGFPISEKKGAKECNSCKYIWFSLFFSPGAPRRLQTTNGPENPVSLLENRPFEKCMSSYLLF